MAAPVNYTTQIAAVKTVGEMQAMLAAAGAKRIAVDYDPSPCALTFAIETEFGPRVFQMPVNIGAMHRLLIEKDRRKELKSGAAAIRSSREQAERVAWRIMKDWLGAQLALIESGMVDLEQVMLPYLRVDGETLNDTQSLYERYKKNELLELVVGK